MFFLWLRYSQSDQPYEWTRVAVSASPWWFPLAWIQKSWNSCFRVLPETVVQNICRSRRDDHESAFFSLCVCSDTFPIQFRYIWDTSDTCQIHVKGISDIFTMISSFMRKADAENPSIFVLISRSIAANSMNTKSHRYSIKTKSISMRRVIEASNIMRLERYLDLQQWKLVTVIVWTCPHRTKLQLPRWTKFRKCIESHCRFFE